MKIILKADDLGGYPGKNKTVPQRWQRFVNIIQKYNIKANIGIIGNSLIFNDTKYFAWIKKYHTLGFIEFFNHGFLHRQFNFDGEIYQEFKGTSVKYQYNLISYTNELLKEKTGIQFITFGAPYNAIDKNTSLALTKAEIKAGFFLENNFNGLNLQNRLEIEVPVHKVNFKALQKYYTKKDYVVIQVHPNSWENNSFEEFEEAIQFLKNENFTLAREMI